MLRFFILFIALLFSLESVHTQNRIDSLVVYPTNPTVNDSLKVIAYLTFTSSGCPLDSKQFTTLGNSISASSLHCIGMLTTICNNSDTFKLNRLQAGNYSFKLSLSSGALVSPNITCTPGIVPDDSATINFYVRPLVASLKKTTTQKTEFYPNPVRNRLYFKQPPSNYTIRIVNQLGQVVLKKTKTSAESLDVSKLEQGFYFIEITADKTRYQSNFIKT